MKNIERLYIIIAGLIVGAIAILLVFKGNPANMGFCIACFERDIMGALGLHRAAPVQYIRPEIIGLVLGALVAALLWKEFDVKAGSAPITRFLLGMLVMIGALVFLGCPLRMVLRLGGGDLNALVALFGFIAGILAGVGFLKLGFNLGTARETRKIDGWIFPALMVVLLILLLWKPVFNPGAPVLFKGKPVVVEGQKVTSVPGPIFFSKTPPTEPKPFPGAMHAPIWLALLGGILVGIAAQRTRLCLAGGIRDTVLVKDTYLLNGFLAILLIVLVGNLILGKFTLGFEKQPIAHTEHLWNFLGMSLVGLGSILLGGCPLRQLILAGSGNTDSAMAVLGIMGGAAVAHNFMFAAGKLPTGVMGVTNFGKAVVVIGLVIAVVIGLLNSEILTKSGGQA
jgi:YedE family putative selenium metabolism protein